MKTLPVLLMSAGLCLAMLGCSESGLVDTDTGSEGTAIQQDAEATTASKNEVKYAPWKERGSGMPTTDPSADLGLLSFGAAEY